MDIIFEQGYLRSKQDKLLKSSGFFLQVRFEGSVSQIFYLGPRFYFMLCRDK